MTTRIIVCLIALSVGVIQLFRGDYLPAMLALIIGIIFLISIVNLANKFDEDDDSGEFLAKDESYDDDEDDDDDIEAEDDDLDMTIREVSADDEDQ